MNLSSSPLSGALAECPLLFCALYCAVYSTEGSVNAKIQKISTVRHMTTAIIKNECTYTFAADTAMTLSMSDSSMWSAIPRTFVSPSLSLSWSLYDLSRPVRPYKTTVENKMVW